MSEGGFHLHKWHSNVTLMEMEACNSDNEPTIDETTYAKTLVGTKSFETKILGIPWNKQTDKFTINLAKRLKGAENAK